MNDFRQPPSLAFQTTFGYGLDHFSRTHVGHQFGSREPVQRDFGLNLPNDRFRPLCGMDSPPGVTLQTTLMDFRKP